MVCGAAAPMVTVYAEAAPDAAASRPAPHSTRIPTILPVRAWRDAGVTPSSDAGGDDERSCMATRRVPLELRHRGCVGHAPVIHVGGTATAVGTRRRDARTISVGI